MKTTKWVCFKKWDTAGTYCVIQLTGTATAKQIKFDDRPQALGFAKVVSKDDPRIQDTRDGAIKAMQRQIEADMAELDRQKEVLFKELKKVIALYDGEAE